MRYRVVYSASPKYDYALLDSEDAVYVFLSDTKSEVIAESQRRNGLTPVDGDEQTYSRQIGEFT